MLQARTRSGQRSTSAPTSYLKTMTSGDNSSGWYMSRLESLLIVLLVPLCKPSRRACVPARGPHERLRGCARPEVAQVRLLRVFEGCPYVGGSPRPATVTTTKAQKNTTEIM